MTHADPTLPAPSTGGARLKPSEALRAARALITPKGAWIKGTHAEDIYGNSVTDGWNERAVCWCSYGALEQVTNKDFGETCSFWLEKAMGGYIADFNDAPNRTHAEVLDAFDRAAALAEADEADAARADAGRRE